MQLSTWYGMWGRPLFKAIEKSKVRNQFTALAAGGDWRTAYRESEDFLTAGVFGRLPYLPAPILWNLILQASVHQGLPAWPGQLQSTAFWPRWDIEEASTLQGSYKEPDAFYSFDDLKLIIEAKLGDREGLQNTDQWIGEVIALLFRDEGPEVQAKTSLAVLAVGGLGKAPTQEQARLKHRELDQGLKEQYPNLDLKIGLALLSWRGLREQLQKLDSLLKLGKREYTQGGYRSLEQTHLSLLLNDITGVLALHGIRDWYLAGNFLDNWRKVPPLQDNRLPRFKPKPLPKPKASLNFASLQSCLRISELSLKTLKGLKYAK